MDSYTIIVDSCKLLLIVYILMYRWRIARLCYGNGGKQEKSESDGRWLTVISWHKYSCFHNMATSSPAEIARSDCSKYR